MIHAVLQWQAKKSTPSPRNRGPSPGETRIEAGAETESQNMHDPESGVLPEESESESEAPPRKAVLKTTTSHNEAEAKLIASIPDQVPPLFAHDAGEGPSFQEDPFPKQEEDEEENLEEQTEELKQELDGKMASCKPHPKCPLLGLILTPTRELALQVKQHIDAVAKFTGMVHSVCNLS